MPCPEVTKLWHDADGVVGKTLRKFARAINNTLAFASQKVKRPNNLPGSSNWSPTVVIQGRVHHFIGSLAPNDNQSKQFVQTYINDPSMSEYTDGDSSSIDSDVGGASDEDSDASWLPSD